jgi:ATP-dependent Clp protease ATP-binding subunit ClpC
MRAPRDGKQHFRPEFLDRVDDVIVFPQLTQDEIIEIVDMFVGRLEKRLKDKDMGIELTTAAKVLLATRGYDPWPRRWPDGLRAFRSRQLVNMW